MPNNGWYSVYEDERPESGEEILTLAYCGDFPAPENMFDAQDSRAYCVCTYFYPGDQDWNEIPGDPIMRIPTDYEEVTFDEEGFYVCDAVGPRNAGVWRRLKEVREGLSRGILFWKRLDNPTIH